MNPTSRDYQDIYIDLTTGERVPRTTFLMTNSPAKTTSTSEAKTEKVKNEALPFSDDSDGEWIRLESPPKFRFPRTSLVEKSNQNTSLSFLPPSNSSSQPSSGSQHQSMDVASFKMPPHANQNRNASSPYSVTAVSSLMQTPEQTGTRKFKTHPLYADYEKSVFYSENMTDEAKFRTFRAFILSKKDDLLLKKLFDIELEELEFYHPNCNRELAKFLLENKNEGTFLYRKCSKDEDEHLLFFAKSMVCSGEIIHVHIAYDKLSGHCISYEYEAESIYSFSSKDIYYRGLKPNSIDSNDFAIRECSSSSEISFDTFSPKELMDNYKTLLDNLIKRRKKALELIQKNNRDQKYRRIEDHPQFVHLKQLIEDSFNCIKKVFKAMKKIDLTSTQRLEIHFASNHIALEFQALEKANPEINFFPYIPCDPYQLTRHMNILCPVSAIQVSTFEKDETGFHKSETRPIHANYVTIDQAKYIAAQAPLNREHFWRMILETRILTIVDLAAPEEFGGDQAALTQEYIDMEESPPYLPDMYPDEGQKLEFDTLVVSHEEEILRIEDTFKITAYTIFDKVTETTSTFTKIHFLKWKDHDASSIDFLIILNQIIDNHLEQLRSLAEAKEAEEQAELLLVRCKAGVGRTGTLITARSLIKRTESQVLTKTNIYDTIKELILTGRSQRGPHFVQSSPQFELLLDLGKFLTDSLEEVKTESSLSALVATFIKEHEKPFYVT